MGAARRLPVVPFAAGIALGALLGWHRSSLTGVEPSSSRAEAFVPAPRPIRSVAARTPATVEQGGPRGAGGEDDARTRGPYYGDVEQPGELERMVRLVSLNGELVLLHGDENRLRMIVNLVAQLNGHGIDHTLLLGFTPGVCQLLERRRRIACAHSSFMTDASPRADAARRWRLAHKYVAWIQKFELMRRLVEVRTPGSWPPSCRRCLICHHSSVRCASTSSRSTPTSSSAPTRTRTFAARSATTRSSLRSTRRADSRASTSA